jgi:arylsulfatase A-like enzyme
MSDAQQTEHLAAINRLNRLHRDRHLGQPDLDGRIETLEMAFDLQKTAPQVFDLSKESRSTLELYGDNQFSRHCLTARRLVENGVRFVEILDGATGRKWDAHGNRGGLIDNHRKNAARTDQGITALIKDLKSRGLLDETLVVWATEFGRTPFEEANKEKKIGRGHHHKGFTLWMAGGGVKGGLSYGATDQLGMHAEENPVSYHDFHATILHLLGLDHKRLTFRHNSREVRLTDVFGNVVHEIMA